jgi:hypothetical protein
MFPASLALGGLASGHRPCDVTRAARRIRLRRTGARRKETMVFGIHDGAHPLRAVINFEVETWLSPRTE